MSHARKSQYCWAGCHSHVFTFPRFSSMRTWPPQEDTHARQGLCETEPGTFKLSRSSELKKQTTTAGAGAEPRIAPGHAGASTGQQR